MLRSQPTQDRQGQLSTTAGSVDRRSFVQPVERRSLKERRGTLAVSPITSTSTQLNPNLFSNGPMKSHNLNSIPPVAGGNGAAMPITEQVLSQLNKEMSLDAWTLPLHDRFSRNYSGLYSPLKPSQFFPFPEFLLQQIDSAECKCFMGVFPQIKRVWLTVDNRLFLWNYADGGDFYSYEGMTDIILTVGLVKPRSGIFHEDIEYLLVLVSSTDIKLFGVSNANDEFTLFATQLSAPTDNVLMLSVAGTENGQIFLGGRNGKLYELAYEAEETWFTRRCTLKCLNSSLMSSFIPTFLSSSGGAIISIVLDEKRKLLYTMSDESEIQVYRLTELSDNMNRYEVTYALKYSVIDECKKFLVKTVDMGIGAESFQTLALYVIPQTGIGNLGKNSGLVAVSSRGYRLYFMVDPGDKQRGTNVSLELDHIRGLPSLEDERDLNTRALPFTQFDTCFYSEGYFFSAGTSAQAGNILFVSSLDPGPLLKTRMFAEWSSIANSTDRVWDIAEITPGNSEGSNVLVKQVTQNPRFFVFLTNQGVYIAEQQRPIDIMVNLLLQSSGYENQALKRFIDSYPDEQICAMALAIACNNPYVFGTEQTTIDSQLKSWASQLFLRFGVLNQLDSGVPFNDYEIGKPLSASMSNLVDGNLSISFRACIIYLSRMASQIWNRKISEITEMERAYLQQIVACGVYLKTFLKQIIANVNLSTSELAYFDAFINIVDVIVQGSHFTLLLLPTGFRNLIERIPTEILNFANICTFNIFTCTVAGHDLVREFTKLIIQDIIASNTNIDPICANLKDGCPLFFKSEDIMIYKAQEYIQMAQKRKDDPIELLEKASKLLISAAQNISLHTLQGICESFRQLGYPEGSIVIPVICAKKYDSENLSLQYYRNTSLSEFATIYHHRLEYYQVAFDTIKETITGLPVNPDVQTQEFYKNSPVIQEILKVDDELFMNLFFDYMLAERQLIYLIKLPNVPYLQLYLQDRQYEKAELGFYLGLLYRNTRQYDQAVIKFKHLAESPKSAASLEKRLEYLSWALNIAQSQLTSDMEPDFLTELKDLYDVALIQFEILRSLEALSVRSPVLQDLNRHLLNVTELYQICEEFNLYESKLSIFKVSNHRDEELLVNTWRSILASEVNEDRYSKIVSLGERFGRNDIAFPLDLLITMLETESYELNPDEIHDWIFTALLDAGFAFSEVFDVYDQLFEDKRPPFNERDGQLYLLSQILALFDIWVRSSPASTDLKVIDEHASRYISFLSIGSGSAKVAQLSSGFKELLSSSSSNAGNGSVLF